jgi:hypothetical protein
MLITVQTILDLQPCSKYSRERLAELIPSAGICAKDALPIVLALPRADARWVLARLLSVQDRVAWAQASTDRAKGYAAAYAAEHRLACEHALALLGGLS